MPAREIFQCGRRELFWEREFAGEHEFAAEQMKIEWFIGRAAKAPDASRRPASIRPDRRLNIAFIQRRGASLSIKPMERSSERGRWGSLAADQFASEPECDYLIQLKARRHRLFFHRFRRRGGPAKPLQFPAEIKLRAGGAELIYNPFILPGAPRPLDARAPSVFLPDKSQSTWATPTIGLLYAPEFEGKLPRPDQTLGSKNFANSPFELHSPSGACA